MAKMKSEVSQKYYDQYGATLRDKFIRNSSTMAAKISGWKARPVNLLQKTKLARKFIEWVAGFDNRRVLPDYAPKPFYQWFRQRPVINGDAVKKVVLFADTYLNYHEPQIGIAATELLESMEYQVILAHVGCCQRPKISHGFLREAKKEGSDTVKQLEPWLRQGYKVVVCEPSCASALNDDLPDLIEDQEMSRLLKEHIVLIDEFIVDEVANGGYSLKSRSPKLAVHGHCHQKALYGTAAVKNLYSMASADCKEIPSGCCGMAGSFGYEKEHYEISSKIGNEILVPAVQSLKDTHTIVANGFSCRHQIDHLAGVKAKHWLETVKIEI